MIGVLALISALQQPAPAALVRDSAQVRIVENPMPRATPRAPFIIGDAPRLQIGDEGDPALTFARIVQASRTPDGRILVADRGTADIRLFSKSGAPLERLGRRGGGPGEFQSLSTAWVVGADSIVAWDSNGRITVFPPGRRSPSTTTVRSRSEARAVNAVPLGPPFSDGSMIVYRLGPIRVPAGTAVVRDLLVVELVRADGMILSEIGRFAGREVIVSPGGSMPGPSGPAMGFSRSGVPFARETYLRATQRGLLSTEQSGRYEIEVRNDRGELRMLVRTARAAPLVTAEIIRKHRAEPRRVDTPARPNPSPSVDASYYPRTLPAYAGLLSDAADRIWARLHPLPGEVRSRWDVFQPDGVLLGEVAMPPGFEPTEIGTDYVLGVWRDDLDVEHVRMYSLRRD